LFDRTDKPESREFCGIILEEVDRMDGIVQELLDFSRNRDLTLTPTDVETIVQNVAREFQSQLETAKVVMTINSAESPLHALGNSDKLNQVFTNIVRNAIQAMPDGGTVTVDIRREAAEAMNLIHIRFSDTGTGMTPDVLSRIFNPFYTTKDVGTGLGLSICQKIIEKHGGRITASSEPGQGSAFDIFLPEAP
jgi:two-component system sporulation sensor kinase A